jgi:hypothetical protein
MPANVVVLKSQPGIKRDGTIFEGDFYIDGQWVRFQRGLPRKMRGYRTLSLFLTEISRGFHSFTEGNYIYCHSGSDNYLERFTLDTDGNPSVISDRTPSGYAPSANNCWMFDVMFSSVSLSNFLIAHVAQNEDNIASTSTGYIYTGDITGTGALTAVSLPANANATGGIVVLHPYLFYYGTAGIVGWSVAGKPDDLTNTGSGQARVAGQKIVKGLPLRAGAGSAPAGLFWAYDALIRCTFTGGTTTFNFDTISAEISVLSQNSIIEYDGIYYWCGVDRFLMFNGVVRELPNNMNLNFFYDNLNQEQRQKVFAVKVPRFGEIWWCFPFGDATECTHAIVYNVRENTWYDTVLPNNGRASASFSPVFAAPIMTGTTNQDGLGYKVWRHEIGVDEIDGISVNPIISYFETSDLSLAVMNNQSRKLKISYIEPDFVQVGDMTVEVVGRANARAPTVVSNTVTFVDNPGSNPAAQIVPFKEQRREMRVKFTSNAVNGDYQMGQVLMHVEPGDGSITG